MKTSKINIQLIVYLREEDQLLKFRNKFIAKRIGTKTLASLLAFGMALGSPMAVFADDGETAVVAENTVQAKKTDGSEVFVSVSDYVRGMMESGAVRLNNETGYLEDTSTGQKVDPETGERITTDTSNLPPLYQTVFGETLVELAEKNPKIVGITPAMPTGCSMNLLMKAMPDRAFDVGIAEGHAATFSGGMAKEGLQPFCNIYSSFMQRAYDNVIHDIAILKLPVVLCLDRAGLVGEDGPTHHGVYDLAYFRPIPNLTISSPMDEHELRRLMYTAQLPDKGPFVIRYPRGRGVLVNWKCPLEEIPVGKGRKLKDGKDLAVITLGPIGNIAARAIKRAEADKGISIAHYDLRFLKPLDETLLHEVGRNFSRILTIEDGARKGGMGSAVLEFMADHDYTPHIKRIGVPDTFIEHGTVQELYRLCGMDEEGIYNILIKNDE